MALPDGSKKYFREPFNSLLKNQFTIDISCMDNKTFQNIELSYLKIEDYQELKEAMINAYSSMPDAYWKEHHIQSLLDKFPEGQIVVKV